MLGCQSTHRSQVDVAAGFLRQAGKPSELELPGSGSARDSASVDKKEDRYSASTFSPSHACADRYTTHENMHTHLQTTPTIAHPDRLGEEL